MTVKEISNKARVKLSDIIKVIKIKYFCKHEMQSVRDSNWYFHYRCSKCGYERGMGNFG